MKTYKIIILSLFLFLAPGIPARAEEKELESLIVEFKYFMYNNQIPFVQVKAGKKADKKYQPVPGIAFDIYLDSLADNCKIGKAVSNFNGNATLAIPKTLKANWDASPTHTLFCTSAATKEYEETEQELEITQAKLLIDTLNDGETRSIVATLMARSDKGWTPVPEADIKLGVKRLGSILSAGSDETYATDEEGVATAAFEREQLPGDKKGNLTLVAKVEDNELYGNLVMEMNAPWGVKSAAHDNFNERTLWATRFKAPYWLLFIANSIIILVWGTIIYLLVQIFKLRKMGKAAAGSG